MTENLPQMKYRLRWYQEEAVDAIYQWFRNHETGNPCAVLPTGSGKTILITKFACDCYDWGKRVLILTHVKELLEQTKKTIQLFSPHLDVGIYSAGLHSRDTEQQILCAGIQSVYNKTEEVGTFDLIIIDEVHTVPEDGNGMYLRFLKEQRERNPKLRVIGLTATPYRLDSGDICGEKRILQEVAYEASIKKMMESGFLTPLVNRHGTGTENIDFDDLSIRLGEFASSEVEAAFNADYTVEAMCSDILAKTAFRNAVLIFAAGVKHAKKIQAYLTKYGRRAEIVIGDTPSDERDALIREFKRTDWKRENERLKYLINVGVLTTGFDAPNVDCVVLARPTASTGLYVQMVGRGLRLQTGKKDCLILDYGENILRHGPIDALFKRPGPLRKGKSVKAPVKICPKCETFNPIAALNCSHCEYEFDVKTERQNKTEFAEREASIMFEANPTTETVIRTEYSRHKPKDPKKQDSLKVTYWISLTESISEWLCPEHLNRNCQYNWISFWKRASGGVGPTPRTIADALDRIDEGALFKVDKITFENQPNSKFKKVTARYYSTERDEKEEFDF